MEIIFTTVKIGRKDWLLLLRILSDFLECSFLTALKFRFSKNEDIFKNFIGSYKNLEIHKRAYRITSQKILVLMTIKTANKDVIFCIPHQEGQLLETRTYIVNTAEADIDKFAGGLRLST